MLYIVSVIESRVQGLWASEREREKEMEKGKLVHTWIISIHLDDFIMRMSTSNATGPFRHNYEFYVLSLGLGFWEEWIPQLVKNLLSNCCKSFSEVFFYFSFFCLNIDYVKTVCDHGCCSCREINGRKPTSKWIRVSRMRVSNFIWII